jgi:hypothetical protein
VEDSRAQAVSPGALRQEESVMMAYTHRGTWFAPAAAGGELIMAQPERLALAPAEPAVVKSCWMCGVRLPVGQMLADGADACADVRWYCLDMRGCTERWTARPARQADSRQGSARATDRGKQLAVSGI